MLIAAMILGLIGGISYFIGGITLIVASDDSPWWAIPLIVIGIVGTIGGALVLWRPSHQVYKLVPRPAFLLLLAGISAIVVGIFSYEEAVDAESGFLFSVYSIPPIVTNHAFAGYLLYQPLPLFALIIAGALAIAGRQRRVGNSGGELEE